jgi:ABC-type antimicrobial peptide transport system permease subunit
MKGDAMNVFFGPIEYLTAFAMVLATGILFGFGLGWHFCGHFRAHPLRERY